MYDITNKIRDTANRINGFEGLREFPSINDISANIISDSTSKSQEKFSDRDPESTSPRNLLANALEGTVSNDVERKKLAEYKKKIALITAEEDKLTELRRQIKELSFGKDKIDSEKLKKLREEATEAVGDTSLRDMSMSQLESVYHQPSVARCRSFLRIRMLRRPDHKRCFR